MLQNTICRLELRNGAQHGTICWASQAQRQPTMGLFRSSIAGRGDFFLMVPPPGFFNELAVLLFKTDNSVIKVKPLTSARISNEH